MLYERMAANALDLDYAAIQNQRLKPADKDKMRAYFEKLCGQERFFVLDDVYTIEGISAAAARLRPALVVVDYLQKVGTLQRLPNLRERTEYISGELKRIAKYGRCCVIALSQVSRAGREAPTMSDLKESGALEADGDYILLAHRPYVVNKGRGGEGHTELLVDKNKFGRTGKMAFRFSGSRQRFEEA